jgi:hypothetical protein
VRRRAALALLALAPAGPVSAAEQRHPDVLAANVRARGDEVFDFDVTLSSPYDSAARYADAFRVIGPDGTVYGERLLLHDHAAEQPFTRELHGVRIPRGVASVTLQGRDRRHGWGGGTFELRLPGR